MSILLRRSERSSHYDVIVVTGLGSCHMHLSGMARVYCGLPGVNKTFREYQIRGFMGN